MAMICYNTITTHAFSASKMRLTGEEVEQHGLMHDHTYDKVQQKSLGDLCSTSSS